MKSDLNTTLNKLVSYAFDNLLLDPLDSTYTLNRLATACGVSSVTEADADYGELTFAELLTELKSLAPSVDLDEIKDILFPMPRTVGTYFAEEQAKGVSKAFEFLFELYANGDRINGSPAVFKNGFTCYARDNKAAYPISLDVAEPLGFTPLALGDRVSALENPDILSDDIVSREVAFVSEYGGVIATRIGAGTEYLCAWTSALENAPVKEQLSDGAVKTALLDYPVPALKFTGIAKNAVAREATRIVKAAADAALPCVVAATKTDGIAVYAIFAKDITPEGYIVGSDALAACGVFQAKDCTPLLSVLEKGTALSTDLSEFRPIYDKIGGVKLGAEKAKAALGETLCDMGIALLKAAPSATESQVKQLTENK